MSDVEDTNGVQSPSAAAADISMRDSPAPSNTSAADAPANGDNDAQSDVEHNEDADDLDDAAERDDNDSELSEVDEAEFADFDPTTIHNDDRPAKEIDEEAVKQLKASKRKRVDGEPKKPKEGKREKKKRRERKETSDDYDDGADGEILEGKRRTKTKRPTEDGEQRQRERVRDRRAEDARQRELDEENMTPEQRRAAALDRAMDAALKNPNKRRRKKDEIDLEAEADEEIADLKLRMEAACQADNAARETGEPAINKLKLLPEVVKLLNRNTIRHTLVDPETNFLQSVKFFLEPLNDGSLPSYNIQRDLFAALERLPIDKEALMSSGIGKVVVFYTKSKKPEVGIKRVAERLLADWSRPILKRTDDYKKRKIATKDYDSQAAQLAIRQANSQGLDDIAPVRQRDRALEKPVYSNRARMETHSASYTVAPRSTFDPSRGDGSQKPLGAAGMDAFRRMTQKKIARR